MTRNVLAWLPKTRKRRILLGIGVFLLAGFLFLLGKWKEVTQDGGQIRMEPFRIAGSLYYVGTKDVTAYLLIGPEGHILIDGGYPGTAPLILHNIALLGFRITDVKILLNSHAHFDHAGALKALQDASGAELWVSEGDAESIASGGVYEPTIGPMRLLAWLGVLRYPAPIIDHRFRDGDTIRLGPLKLTGYVTAGHTRGCTTWAIPLRENNRDLLAVSIGSLTVLPAFVIDTDAYPTARADFEKSFVRLRSLPTDIFLGSHASFFSLRRKMQERVTAPDYVTPFLDREGYLRFIDQAEKDFHAEYDEEVEKK